LTALLEISANQLASDPPGGAAISVMGSKAILHRDN